MYNNWNINCLKNSESIFNQLTIQEKFLCSCLACCGMELSSFQLNWLLKDLSNRKCLNYNPKDEDYILTIISPLIKKSILIENNNKYKVSDSYYPFAYRFPLNNKVEDFCLTIHNFANSSDFSFEYSCKQNLFSSLLIELISGNINTDILTSFEYSFLNNNILLPLFNKILEPFDEEWFEKLPEVSQIFLLNYAIHYEILTFNKIISLNDHNIFNYFMKAKWYKSDLFINYASHNLALYLIFKGNFDRAKSYVEISTSIEAKGINAFLVYLFHGSSDCIKLFHESIKYLQKIKSKRNITLFSLAEIFYFISLLQDGSSDSLYESKKYTDKIDKISLIFRPAFQILYEFYTSRIIGKYNSEKILNFLSNPNFCPFLTWLTCFISYWIGLSDKDLYEKPIKQLISLSKNSELNLIYAETLNLSKALNISIKKSEESFLNNWESNYIIPLADRVQHKQKWEYVLDELSSKLNLPVLNNDSSVRIIWDLKYNSGDEYIKIIPKEQQKLKNGEWSIGKLISLDSYFDEINPFPDFYSNQDINIYKSLQHLRPWLSSTGEQSIKFFKYLINCPNVYLNDNHDSPVEIIKGDPVLMFHENEEGYFFKFHPEYKGESIIAKLESDKRIRIYEFSEKQLLTANILTEQNVFPKSALNKLKTIVDSLSTIMPIHSCVVNTKAPTPVASVSSSSQIYAQLEPIGNGLKVTLCVKPFGSEGPSFVPGKGEDDVFTQIAGQNLHTKRNLNIEIENLKDCLSASHLLANEITENSTALFNSPELSLELLLDFKNISNLITEWPENTKPRKVMAVKFSDFNFRIKSSTDWFTLEGELKIDENHVIDLQKILKHYQKGNRFIQIDEDKFIAITEEFRAKIEDIQAFTLCDDKQSIFHNSVIQIMDDLLSECNNVNFDRDWYEKLNHLKYASEKKFLIPDQFKGQLRNYQIDGYNWLSRMSYLGLGACLADDMGLGKTIEALSIITARASLGPAFVLAPTSVCSNWFSECKRFAPSLNPILFSQSDRKETIKNLAPNDLIICSYGVLQREIEDLAGINWSTVVLDEAQAIKNMSTNRSQAAMLLKGQFKMLMTGTPIENHLGELWNLFRFLNPGLLGSINTFNEKFAVPIQSFNDKSAQERLKKLVRPFILRRTKNQVLKDLPPRTEITLNVDLSPEEANLYESFRREALEKINDTKEKSKESKPMIVLAEIMRLRRLCCNPSLVMPNMNIKSSKLSLLDNIIEELLANGHKALIFSQFVDHLTIIRKFFDEKGYNYQYLDGSTTIKARNKAIKEFQNGNGDFFLISLKAGGQGINLTAADYVIHMDPWWNPAVEDQASDRAHRIGQTKPVTIYKLITSNTIEEKIVQLHGKKRDLADGLLEGTDITGRISTNELISLINHSVIQNSI